MRELILIRHAIAYERDRARWPDDADRPLTPKGARRFRKAARGIARAVPKPDELLTSPLARTRQTARILRRTARFPRAELLEELRPEVATCELLAALRNRSADRVAIVGHEPCLSRLIAAGLRDRGAAATFAMKKGGVAWLAFENGRAKLIAFVPPRLLRGLE